MKRKILALLLSLAMLLSIGGMVEGTLAVGISVDSTRSSVTLGEVDPAVTPTPEAESTVEPEGTPEATPAPTVEPEATVEPTPAPTVEPEATVEPTPAPTVEPTETETPKECTCDPKPAEGEAHKEGCPLYVEPETKDYTELYEQFMATMTMDELNTLYDSLSEAELAAFQTWLTENEKLEALEEHILSIMPEEDPVEPSIKSYTNVAPLLPAPVLRRTWSLKSAANNESDNGIVLSKTAEATADGYKITMEAYATGESTTTSSAEPADIVLVLDVSGSMDDYITEYKEVYQLSQSREYYIQNNGSYTQVEWRNRYNSWGYYTGVIWLTWNRVEPKTSSDDTNSNHVQFYEQVTSTETKLESLQKAVNSFIRNVAEKSPASKIAIVKFAGTKKDEVGNDTYQEGWYTYNYSQIVKYLTSASKSSELQSAINGLTAGGATSADYGMKHAQAIINSAANDGNKKVVIMFTDGEPNHSNGFSLTVANDTISASKDIKGAGATVYTIGLFGGADGTPGSETAEDASDGNKYMHYVSSNYKNAESMSNPGSATYPDDGKSYCLSAGSSGELNNIFTQISQEVGGSTTTLDASATIKDIVTPYFTMPANTTDVKVYTANSDGSIDDWNDRVEFADANVTLNPDDNSISVSGFSFKDNWCGTHTENGTTTFHNGKKLIIEFTVTHKDGFLGGNNVFTNGEKSGLYENSSAENALEAFPRPQVNVPIQDVTVTAANKNVYLLGGLTADELKSGATVTVGSVALDLSKANKNYGLKAWQTEYVDITVKLCGADGTTEINDLSDLTADTTYTISVTVAPKTNGVGAEGTPATAKTGSDDASINVFKPELTFKDSEVYYGAVAPTNADYKTNNLTATAWKHGATLDTAVTMIGTAPELTLTYTPEGGKIADGKVNTKQDIAVDVAVKINGTDVTDYTTFNHTACNPACGWNETTLDGSPAFLLHVKTCTLTIAKAGGTDGEPYVFTVYKDGAKYTEVTIVGNNSVTIYELPVGTYTIEEDTGWSWRFPNPTIGSGVELKADNASGEITCTNAQSKPYWLNGFSEVVKNIFGIEH